MMAVVIIGVVAIGLGALATFLLATQVPVQILLGGNDHGRFAYLSDDEAADASSHDTIRTRPLRREFINTRSRNAHKAIPLRDRHRHRTAIAERAQCRGAQVRNGMRGFEA